MKLNRTLWNAGLAALSITFFVLPKARACGVPIPGGAGNYHAIFGEPSSNRGSFDPFDDSIVGFWHVKFVSKGSGAVAPDGAEIDAGYSQWHSDHTEIMNSAGRTPLMGNFCLGVWKQMGERTYKLNHFAAAFDASGLNLIGPANIQETVTLDRDGDSFKGTFSIDQYTEAGNRVVHLQGNITGTRITESTPPSSIF